jgi:hypothetical protein
MGKLLFALLTLTAAPAWAYEPGELFLDPHLGVGFNTVQGTYFMAGLDVGYSISEQLAAGLGAFYAAGKRPEHDRVIGGGPFVSYVQPLVPVITLSLREDIAHIDQHTPVLVRTASGAEEYSHVNEHGVASITSIGLHFTITRNFGFSAGYRAVLSLSNTDIGKDRSGTFLGFSIGI